MTDVKIQKKYTVLGEKKDKLLQLSTDGAAYQARTAVETEARRVVALLDELDRKVWGATQLGAMTCAMTISKDDLKHLQPVIDSMGVTCQVERMGMTANIMLSWQ